MHMRTVVVALDAGERTPVRTSQFWWLLRVQFSFTAHGRACDKFAIIANSLMNVRLPKQQSMRFDLRAGGGTVLCTWALAWHRTLYHDQRRRWRRFAACSHENVREASRLSGRRCVCVIALLHARVRDWICNQYTAPPNRAERSAVVKSAACVLERRECACEIISGQNQTMPSLNATGLHSFITCCLCGTVEQWRRCLLSSNELKNISSRDDCAELALVCVCVCALLVSAAT